MSYTADYIEPCFDGNILEDHTAGGGGYCASEVFGHRRCYPLSKVSRWSLKCMSLVKQLGIHKNNNNNNQTTKKTPNTTTTTET